MTRTIPLFYVKVTYSFYHFLSTQYVRRACGFFCGIHWQSSEEDVLYTRPSVLKSLTQGHIFLFTIKSDSNESFEKKLLHICSSGDLYHCGYKERQCDGKYVMFDKERCSSPSFLL